jgi:chemotaxis protein CheD
MSAKAPDSQASPGHSHAKPRPAANEHAPTAGHAAAHAHVHSKPNHPLTAHAAETPKPAAVNGFEKIQRYWDPALSHWNAKILPGEYYVTRADEAITTVLGSCISACIRDPSAQVGGMNHFMLPEDSSSGDGNRWLDPVAGLATRYGSHAMESLINELLKLGASRSRFEIKLFGAGRILASVTDVGARNIEFVHDYLKTEGFCALAEDLGDIYPRRVVYFPASGKVKVRKLRPLEATAIAERERKYLTDIGTGASQGGDVELFD